MTDHLALQNSVPQRRTTNPSRDFARMCRFSHNLCEVLDRDLEGSRMRDTLRGFESYLVLATIEALGLETFLLED